MFFCRQEDRGFTLLEVLIAIAILALTLSSLFGSQARSLSLATEAQFNLKASLLAREKLAEYESGVIALHDDSGDFGEKFPGYFWKAEISDPPIGENEATAEIMKNLKQVDVLVYWQDEKKQSYSLRCLVRKKQNN